ncbi:hypothetical protein Tco_0030846 [Tanacetum coccineum]
MAQHVILAAQLVPQYKPIRRCNNYTVLQSIPCSPECKIVGLILLDHCLSHALTATADVPSVYLQQFWRTVSKERITKKRTKNKAKTTKPDSEWKSCEGQSQSKAKDQKSQSQSQLNKLTVKTGAVIEEYYWTLKDFEARSMPLNKPNISHLETPKNPFVAPANIHTIEAFMNRVGYQGVVDKVSAFFTKNLAQPWQTMFKVFNRCLTTRTSGHDQTKINILQMFHVVLNQTHVDYAALLWWDFMNNVFYKKEAIQYPRFIKLIVADLMKKFPNIPKRLEEDYHSIKDDVPLVSVYTTGNVSVRGMLIPDAFLTAEIRETDDFKEYETVFMKVAVPMNQPQPVISTQGTNRNTPRSPRMPTISASPQESKKRKDEVVEATILSLTLHKTALDVEDKENVAKVQEMLEQKEIDKLVDGDEDEESYASFSFLHH